MMIKKFLLSVLLISVIATAASAEFNLNFTLHNNSGYTFKEVWVSPHNNSEWHASTDRVNMRPLRSGYYTKITFNNVSRARRNERYWDLRVYYADTWHEWRNIRFSAITDIWVDRNFYARWE